MRGQAMAEFALILPIMLVLILGTIGVGFLFLIRMEITHAAQEAAEWGASHPQADCAAVLVRVDQVYGRAPSGSSCVTHADMVEVTVWQETPVVVPLVPLPTEVTVTQRALVREHFYPPGLIPDPTPTPTPDPTPAP